MTYIFFLIVIYLFTRCKLRTNELINGVYLDKDNTNAIKGLFVLLIFISHFSSYINLGDADLAYIGIKNHLDQAVVVPFLFYSGYGMMQSLFQKGEIYVKSLILKRIPRVLLSFMIAVIIYALGQILLKNSLSLKQFLFALIGWESVGNSNWYIFGIIGEYLIFWISFFVSYKIPSKNIKYKHILGTVFTILLSVGFIILIKILGKPEYYYNTLILFPIGVVFSFVSLNLEKIIKKNTFNMLLSIFVVFTCYFFTYIYRAENIIIYGIWCISFMMIIILFSMNIKIESIFLTFLGKHVFSIYVLQRIPMMLLRFSGLSLKYSYFSLIAALLITLIISVIYDYILRKIFNKISLY